MFGDRRPRRYRFHRRPRARAARAAHPHADPRRPHGDAFRCSVWQRVLSRRHHPCTVDAADGRPDHHPAGGITAGMAIMRSGSCSMPFRRIGAARRARWWVHRAGLVAAYSGLLLSPLRIEGCGCARPSARFGIMLGAAVWRKSDRLSALAGAAGEFVEQTLRLLVNTVSFARIGAFALAHAGLSVAISKWRAPAGGFGYWIVLALGNVLSSRSKAWWSASRPRAWCCSNSSSASSPAAAASSSRCRRRSSPTITVQEPNLGGT